MQSRMDEVYSDTSEEMPTPKMFASEFLIVLIKYGTSVFLVKNFTFSQIYTRAYTLFTSPAGNMTFPRIN